MSETQHLADALEGLFARDHGWFTPFSVAVDGLSAAEAATIPAPNFHSIWAVVNHIRFWQEVALLQLQGIPVDRRALGAENGWPPVDHSGDEGAWRAACERAISANAELARRVMGLSDEELEEPIVEGRASRWQVIHGLIGHNSYHTSEITRTRRMMGTFGVSGAVS